MSPKFTYELLMTSIIKACEPCVSHLPDAEHKMRHAKRLRTHAYTHTHTPKNLIVLLVVWECYTNFKLHRVKNLFLSVCQRMCRIFRH